MTSFTKKLQARLLEDNDAFVMVKGTWRIIEERIRHSVNKSFHQNVIKTHFTEETLNSLINEVHVYIDGILKDIYQVNFTEPIPFCKINEYLEHINLDYLVRTSVNIYIGGRNSRDGNLPEGIPQAG